MGGRGEHAETAWAAAGRAACRTGVESQEGLPRGRPVEPTGRPPIVARHLAGSEATQLRPRAMSGLVGGEGGANLAQGIDARPALLQRKRVASLCEERRRLLSCVPSNSLARAELTQRGVGYVCAGTLRERMDLPGACACDGESAGPTRPTHGSAPVPPSGFSFSWHSGC